MWWVSMQETEKFVVSGQDFVDVDEFTYLGVCKEAGAVKTIESKMRLSETKEAFRGKQS